MYILYLIYLTLFISHKYRMNLRSFSVSAEAYSISAVTFSSDRVEDGGNEGIHFILIALHYFVL